MYFRDDPWDLERMLVPRVGVMRQMLEDAGYKVDIATLRDETFALIHVVRSDLTRLAGRGRALRCNDVQHRVDPSAALNRSGRRMSRRRAG